MSWSFPRGFLVVGAMLLVASKPSRAFSSRLLCWKGSRREYARLAGNLDDLFGYLLGNPDKLNRTFTSAEPSAVPNEPGGWRTIDWQNIDVDASEIPDSPVDITMVLDRVIHIKRDDQLRLPGSQISGNKARKMLSLNVLQDFPQCLVSYGGPQSNAMVALAAVTHFWNDRHGLVNDAENRRRFVYYTKKLPRFLKNQPSGNLFRAQSLGMELVELSNNEYGDLFGGDAGGRLTPPPALDLPIPGNSVWIPQGGACASALAGTQKLAEEIVSYWTKVSDGRPLSVVLPGGTCSTAALLHWAMKGLTRRANVDIQVVVIPCVGDASYSSRQMNALYSQMGMLCDDLPMVLPPSPEGDRFSDEYFTFGQPDPLILETFERMRSENQIVLDLIYGAPSWTILLRHLRPTRLHRSVFAGREIMYVHSGGLEGINSQLLRYKYKGLVDMDEIQLPGKTSKGSD